jgi:hypothetical protein
MIQLTPTMQTLVGVEPVDFRKEIDGLVGLAKARLKADPFYGCVLGRRCPKQLREGFDPIGNRDRPDKAENRKG